MIVTLFLILLLHYAKSGSLPVSRKVAIVRYSSYLVVAHSDVHPPIDHGEKTCDKTVTASGSSVRMINRVSKTKILYRIPV